MSETRLTARVRIQSEAWGEGDYVVTINGRAVGQARSQREADVIARWLFYAQDDVFRALGGSNE